MKNLLMQSYVRLETWADRLTRRTFKKRNGAAVLETVLLLIAAIVIVGGLLVFFVGKNGKGGFLSKIYEKIASMLNLEVTTPSSP